MAASPVTVVLFDCRHGGKFSQRTRSFRFDMAENGNYCCDSGKKCLYGTNGSPTASSSRNARNSTPNSSQSVTNGWGYSLEKSGLIGKNAKD
jgi:hypothetical protein